MAQCLASVGAKVIVAGRREEVLKEAATSIGERAAYVMRDVTELSSSAAFVQAVEWERGPIDHLISNAGVHLKEPAEEITDEEFQKVMMAHVNAAFSLSRECG